MCLYLDLEDANRPGEISDWSCESKIAAKSGLWIKTTFLGNDGEASDSDELFTSTLLQNWSSLKNGTSELDFGKSAIDR